MKIVFHRDFKKGIEKLSLKQKRKVGKVLELFEINPYDPQLKNHALKGELKEYNAISAGHNLRLIFKVQGNYEKVIFTQMGTHNQVY